MLNLHKSLDPDAAKLLRNQMSDISEDHYCAGWLGGLEYTLWRMLQGGDRTFGFHEVAATEIQELQRLSTKAGGWVVWDEAGCDKTFVTFEEFLPLFAVENAAHEASLAEFEAKKTICPKCQQKQLVSTVGIRSDGFGEFDYCASKDCDYVTNGGYIWK